MEAKRLMERLPLNVPVIRGLVEVSEEQARWKPSPEKWSILEVLNHLYDEEREDFRQRIDYMLNRPDEDFPGIDPQGWVIEREYLKRDLGESLRNFISEREASLAWLRELSAPDWNTYREHPAAGKMTAGDLLGAWVAHDFLHIRQLSRLHLEYTAHLAAPHSVRYAGDW